MHDLSTSVSEAARLDREIDKTESIKAKFSDCPDKHVSERICLPRVFRMLPLSNSIRDVQQHWQAENTRQSSEAADDPSTPHHITTPPLDKQHSRKHA
jgi:hypothetical protein